MSTPDGNNPLPFSHQVAASSLTRFTHSREDHIAHLIEKEQKLEQYRRKSLAVLNQVESAFQQMEDGDK